MPRHVDHEQRRSDIISASLAIIAEQGLGGLSFRAIAERLGGSLTMVTHYYSSRQALIDHLADDLIVNWEQDLSEIEAGEADPRRRLRLLLEWALPLKPSSLVEEQAWANLLAERQQMPPGIVEAFDARMRGFISDHLAGLVPDDAVAGWTDYLRAVTTGIANAAITMPDAWDQERQLATLDLALQAFERLTLESA